MTRREWKNSRVKRPITLDISPVCYALSAVVGLVFVGLIFGFI